MGLDRFDLFLAVAAVFYAFRIAKPWLRRRREERERRERAELEAIWRNGPEGEEPPEEEPPPESA